MLLQNSLKKLLIIPSIILLFLKPGEAKADFMTTFAAGVLVGIAIVEIRQCYDEEEARPGSGEGACKMLPGIS